MLDGRSTVIGTDATRDAIGPLRGGLAWKYPAPTHASPMPF